MIRLLAIDPGSEQSGFVEYDPDAGAILEHGIAPNEILLARCWRERDPTLEHHLAVEMIDVFGMAGRTVFETCVWIGRFIEARGATDYTKVTRHDVKMHLCQTKRSDDAMVRQVLIARWGGDAVAIGGKGRGCFKAGSVQRVPLAREPRLRSSRGPDHLSEIFLTKRTAGLRRETRRAVAIGRCSRHRGARSARAADKRSQRS